MDARLRAALLWDVPWLESADGGAQQWLRALRLEFVRLGDLNADDLLSTAAHVVQAMMRGDTATAALHRSTIAELGETGQLLAGLLALWLELDPPDAVGQTVDDVTEIIRRIQDTDLRARLLLRLAAFALHHRQQQQARTALREAVNITDLSTRLGVAARRWAVSEGVEIAGFDPYATIRTPDDPLLTLPWVRWQALDAATAISGERLEHHLRGVWDTSFHIGRTKQDELLAAYTQADWCGALDLRGVLRKLLSSQMLLGETQKPDQRRWALVSWATSPQAKAVPAAILASEDQLDAAGAADLLAEVRRDGIAGWQPYVEAAAGVWDLLDDDGARSLLHTLAGLEEQPDSPQLGSLFANLLWRVPDAWADIFVDANDTTRAAMVQRLDPDHIEIMPAALKRAIGEYRKQLGEQTVFDLALAFTEQGTTGSLTPSSSADAITLLEWRPGSVDPSTIESFVDRLQAGARSVLEEARENAWGMGDAGTRHLAELAIHLPNLPHSVIDILIEMCEDDHSAAAWQFGALEGLMILRAANQLPDADVERIRRLHIAPGRGLFGEKISPTLLRAAQLRVYVHSLTDTEVTWLATCARGSDVQSRLVAVAALGDIGSDATPTVEWSLVSGLFDPADEVVVRAVAALTDKATASADVAAVVQARLSDLYQNGSRMVRRQIVRAAANHHQLAAEEILTAARRDRAWSVRREANEHTPA
jgi:hypothetical protein